MKIRPPVYREINADRSDLRRLKRSNLNPLREAIAVQVIFGSPSLNCAGSGICKMLPQTAKIPEAWHCPIWAGQLLWFSSSNSFQLSFRMEQFSSAQIMKCFPANSLMLEEEFPLPLWLTTVLGENHCAIPAGRYPCAMGNTLLINLKFHKQTTNQPHLDLKIRESIRRGA